MASYPSVIVKHLLFVVLHLLIYENIFSQDFESQKNIIIAQLENAYNLDQSTRQAYNSCVSTFTGGSQECLEKRHSLIRQDSINQEVVSKILDKYGWLPVESISEKANNAFFYVIQHGSLEFQLKYAKMVDNAFDRKAITPLEYILFVDRLKSKQGKAQIYGTQAETDNLGNQYLYPIKNWYEVNPLRKVFGIDPIDLSKTPEYNQYPKILNNDSVVLIGHIFREGGIPFSNAVVFRDSTIIGRSNDKGFFIINIKKGVDEDVHISISPDDNGFKKIKQIIRGSKDFYNIYVQFK
jgi:hypothetical protein